MTARARRFRLDPRLLLGLALVAGSVGGVSVLVASLDESEPVYAAASILSAGDRVDERDLTIVRARLDGGAGHYLRPGETPGEGLVVTRTVLEGELVPLGSVAVGAHVDSARIVVTTGGALSREVVPGARVDLWVIREKSDGTLAAPAVLVAGAEVVELAEGGSFLSSSASGSVEVLVPREKIGAVLEALAAGAAVELVPSIGDGE